MEKRKKEIILFWFQKLSDLQSIIEMCTFPLMARLTKKYVVAEHKAENFFTV